MARRASRRLGPLLTAIGLASLSVLAAATPAVGACSAAPIPFQRVVERAEQVFLVTVAQRAMAGSTPESYTLVVREVIRGELPEGVVLPTTVTIAAPVIDACGTILDERITRHLVLALDVPVVDGEAPLTVAWRLLPDGRLENRSDDGPAIWPDLAAFKIGLAGGDIASPAPTRLPAPTSGVDAEAERVPIATIGIVVGLVIGIVAGLLVVLVGRRAAAPRSPRPPTPPGAA